MEKKVDLSMFLDFNSSINFLKKFKEKIDIFNDDNWNIDIYNKNTYEKRLKTMPFFYLNYDDYYHNDIKIEYELLKDIPWYYDFNIYEKVLQELNIIKENDLWDNYKHTKKYISNDNDTKTKNYYPNINEIKKYIPRGYLIPPIDKENIELKIDKTINKNIIDTPKIDNDSTEIPSLSTKIDKENIINIPKIDNDSTERPSFEEERYIFDLYLMIVNIDKPKHIIVPFSSNINEKLTKDKFNSFINKNKDFFDKIINSNNIISSYNDILNYYFDNNNEIDYKIFKNKTDFIINYDKKFISYLDDLLINNKNIQENLLINNENIQENFSNYNSTINPSNDETNRPNSYTNIFNFKNKSWEKKLFNMFLWVFLYILIILFIFAIVISFIK